MLNQQAGIYQRIIAGAKALHKWFNQGSGYLVSEGESNGTRHYNLPKVFWEKLVNANNDENVDDIHHPGISHDRANPIKKAIGQVMIDEIKKFCIQLGESFHLFLFRYHNQTGRRR